MLYLEKVAELDPVRRPEHLARLDHLIGFNTTSDGVSKAQSLSKTYLLTEAKAVGLEINPELRAKIENSNGDDVLFAIKWLKHKSQQEQVKYPNNYFDVVLKDRQSKRNQGNQAT